MRKGKEEAMSAFFIQFGRKERKKKDNNAQERRVTKKNDQLLNFLFQQSFGIYSNTKTMFTKSHKLSMALLFFF